MRPLSSSSSPDAVSCLAQVYNTGRSLEKWRALIEEKRGILAPPDVLISSVGTKVTLASVFNSKPPKSYSETLSYHRIVPRAQGTVDADKITHYWLTLVH